MTSLDRFTTDRLIADRILPEHFAVVRAQDSDETFMRFLGGVRDEQGSRQYLDRNLAHWDEHGHGLYLFRDAASGAPIGRGILRWLDVEGVRELEVGYGFLPPWWGKGLATEITRGLMAQAAWHRIAPTVVALTMPDNTGSCHVLEKCGLRWEQDRYLHGEKLLLYRSDPLYEA